MAYFNKTWTLDRIIEEFQFLAYSLEAEERTAPLAVPVRDFLGSLQTFNAQKKAAQSEQLRLTAMVHAADRALDLTLSALSGQARLMERVNPALDLLGTLFPEGLNAVTKYSGRGVEQELLIARTLLGTVAKIPDAAPLAGAADAVSTACDRAEAALNQLKAVDAQIEALRNDESDLTGRAYTAYHSTFADLVKLFNNNKRHINTYFLS